MAKHKYIETPQKLLDLWDEYKSSVKIDTIQQATSKGDVVSLSVREPYLRSGFEAFAYRKLEFGISQYLDNQDNAYTEYLGVITCIRKEWETDQISGTMTGRYKAPNLTARLNNLTEKVEQTNITQPLFPDVSEDNSDK
jgi:hypothetical protein